VIELTSSKAVQRLGIEHCELCGKPGSEENPLTAHHCDGDRKNNKDENFLVVHRWRCHTFADWVTQEYIYRGGRRASWGIIKKVYKEVHWRV
jgi:hypothetical protein